MTAPTVRALQIWAHRAEPSRRLLVIRTTCGLAIGFDYHEGRSTTRDMPVPIDELVTLWRLVEDTPAHLVPQVEAREVPA